VSFFGSRIIGVPLKNEISQWEAAIHFSFSPLNSEPPTAHWHQFGPNNNC
jgi:hypothetical protein